MLTERFAPNTQDPTPIHLQVSAFLRSAIQAGRWTSGNKLPAEPELAKEFGIARGTLRRAVDDLVEDGILKRVHGRGTFIAAHSIATAMTTAFGTIAEELRAQDINFTTSTLSQEVVQLTSHEDLRHLRLEEPRPALRLKRVRRDQDGPIAYLENTVLLGPGGIDPQIATMNFENVALFDAIEDIQGTPLGRGERILSAVNATARVAALLEIPRATALLYMEQLTFKADGDDSPVEFSRVHINPARMLIHATVSRPNP